MSSIDITSLSFAYPHQGHRLDDVSLSVGASEIYCLLGPNGAGKTTLLKCLLGLLPVHSGSIRLCGQATANLSPRALAKLVAYVPQSATIPFQFSALDIAVMGRTPYLEPYTTPSVRDRQHAFEQMGRLGIAHLADKPFSNLSGGERQLTLLARALIQETPVLVLDEPTASLDFGNEVRLLQIVSDLAKTGKSILMTTHQPTHALGYAHRAVLMRGGRIVADGVPKTVMTSGTLSDLYGVDLHVVNVSLPGDTRGEASTCLHFSDASKQHFLSTPH